jgi:hypothetical protein
MRRRTLLKVAIIGPVALGIPMLYQSPLFQGPVKGLEHLKEKEAEIFSSLFMGWSEGWPTLESNDSSSLAAIDEVLAVVRSDKRAELLLAIKLLAFGPSCFFLTDYFSPWSRPMEVKKILENWKSSQQVVPKKLYMGFSSLFAAAYYGNKKSWAGVGYPGPPEVIKGSAL